MAKIMQKEEATKTGPASTTSAGSQSVEVAPGDVALITFDRWFTSKSFKPHWKAGMAAYTDTSGRKTAAEWDAIFARY